MAKREIIMRRLLLIALACGSTAYSQTVSRSWAQYVGYSTWQLHAASTQAATSIRMAYAVAPTACASGTIEFTGGVNPQGSSSDFWWNTTGKTPGTNYNVCMQAQFGTGTWVTGPQVSILTQGALAASDQPIRPLTFNTNYAPDIASNTNVHSYTVSSGCTDFNTAANAAVAALLTQNAVINMPVGQANGCGILGMPQVAPDVLAVGIGSVIGTAIDNYIAFTGLQKGIDGSTVANGQWPDGTPIVDGQAVTFTQASLHVSGGNGPGSGDTLPGNIFADGRLYYLYLRDAPSYTFYVFDGLKASGGKKVGVWGFNPSGNASAQFFMMPWPRHLKNIVIRTSTPDDQFAAPGTALGGMNWASKMTWITNPKSNRQSRYGGSVMTFGPLYAPPQVMTTLANITFVGILWTVEDDPDAYTTPDPRGWYVWFGIPPTAQGFIFDRNAFSMLSEHQRNVSALYLQGTDCAIVNSYFDYLRFFFGVNDWLGGNGLHQ